MRRLTPVQRDCRDALRRVACELDYHVMSYVTYESHQGFFHPELPSPRDVAEAFGSFRRAARVAWVATPASAWSAPYWGRAHPRCIWAFLKAEVMLFRGGAGKLRKSLRRLRGFAGRRLVRKRRAVAVGYRVWWDGGGELRSLHKRAPCWSPGENLAVCADGHAHQAPALACSCGLYAWNDPHSAQWIGEDSVIGAIAACGYLQIHSTGFRAEKAQVIGLALPGEYSPEVLQAHWKLARSYGVPLFANVELLAEHAEAIRARG